MFEKLDEKKKIMIQVVFWILYYILFGFIWVKGVDYKSSFYLEFILLPIRIFAVYFTILYLIPQFLLPKKFLKFVVSYMVLLCFAGIAQRFFIYFFFDDQEVFNIAQILNVKLIVRSIVLINSTVFFVSSVYILNLYFIEKAKSEPQVTNTIELKSNRRIYRVQPKDITHIEGLGNYVNYITIDGKKITVYQSLKKSMEQLPNHFMRIHKSFIINRHHMKSYSTETVEMISGEFIPIGNSFDQNKLQTE